MKRLFITLAFCFLPLSAHAAGGDIHVPEYHWSFDGVFGKFDENQLQRGFQVYQEVCASCHSLSFIAFRNLADLGYSEDEIKAIAASYDIVDGPDDEGEMFERPGRASDRFPSPFANKKAAESANNGSYPPDLSLMAKARVGGPDYIKSLLQGYSEAPQGFQVGDGQYYNRFMPGHLIAMAPPLDEGYVTYADGSPETLDQYASDIAAFLAWSAEPYMIERKKTGVRVMLYVAFMTFIFFLTYKRARGIVKGKS